MNKQKQQITKISIVKSQKQETMNKFEVLEIASFVGIVSGIILSIFFVVSSKMIENKTKASQQIFGKKSLMLLLLLVWSITITTFTFWIYNTTNNDGGEQPIIKEINGQSTVEVAQPKSITTLVLNASTTNTAANQFVKLLNDDSFFLRENIDENEVCGLHVQSFVWLSFNEVQPYYQYFQDKKVKVILKNIDVEQNNATFIIHLREDEQAMKLHHFTLEKNDFYDFTFNNCDYRFYYKGKTTSTTGLKYWFQKRYSGHFLIKPKNG